MKNIAWVYSIKKVLFGLSFLLTTVLGEAVKPEEKILKRPKIGIGILVINEQNQVLMGRRKGAHGSETWAPPGGHLEFGETPEACAQRELLEETGLIALEIDEGPWVNDIIDNDKHYITIFMQVTAFKGEPQLLEPDKCAGWQWFSWENLPEPLFPSIRSLLNKSHYIKEGGA